MTSTKDIVSLDTVRKVKGQGQRREINVDPLDLIADFIISDDEMRIEDERFALDCGRVLLTMRKEAGLTQAVLAAKVGTDQSEIARLEKGNNGRLPNVRTLRKIYAACGYRMKLIPEKITAGIGISASGGSVTNLKPVKTGG
jgi:DNA-binding XRE family transcriptional regulator